MNPKNIELNIHYCKTLDFYVIATEETLSMDFDETIKSFDTFNLALGYLLEKIVEAES